MSSFPGHDYTSVAKLIDLLSLAVRRRMLGTKYLSDPLSNTIDCLVFLPIVNFKVPKFYPNINLILTNPKAIIYKTSS